MSDETTWPEELAVLVADTALAVPGVIRLEPTLRGQLRRWSGDPATAIRSGLPELPDGVVVHDRQGLVEARIEVAVRPTRPADVIAAEIRESVARLITASGRSPGMIMVSVLAVEIG